jgi:DTW domain-containing protein YfiP
MPFPTARSIHF